MGESLSSLRKSALVCILHIVLRPIPMKGSNYDAEHPFTHSTGRSSSFA